MVGTIHLYEEARPTLKAILNELNPRVLTVEISRFSIDFRQRHHLAWKERLERAIQHLGLSIRDCHVLELLKRQISMPYEWQVAKSFAVERGVRVVPIDISELSKMELPLWEEELLSEKNIKCIVLNSRDETLDRHFNRIRCEAASLLKGIQPMRSERIHPLTWLGDPFWQRREKILFRRLMRIVRLAGGVVHVSGWMHCVAGSPWQTLTDHIIAKGQEVTVIPAF